MNIKHIQTLLATLLLGVSTTLMAQELKQPTLHDLIPGGETYRYAENIYGLQWWGEKCIKPEMEEVKAIDPRTGKENILFTRNALNEALKKAGVNQVAALYSLKFPWSDKTIALLPKANRFATYNWVTGEVTKRDDLPKEPYGNIDLNNKSGNIAYTVENNLYVNGKQITDEPEGVVCGTSVHRNEFGISKGTYWSPSGNQLAFYRMDESMVTQYPLVDITARIGEVENVRYPMAGMTSHQVSIGIYNIATQRVIFLNTGDPTDRYFTNISWAPDEKSIYLIEVNRDQNHAKLCQYNAEDGNLVKILFEERHEKYVEPQNPILFLPWDDTKFIYQSQRNGFNHLYLFDTTGKEFKKELKQTLKGYKKTQEFIGSLNISDLHKQLTEGNWMVQDILGFNTKKQEIYILSTEQSPLQSNIYKVNIKNGKRTLIGSAEGVHRAQLSTSGEYLIDSYSTPTLPRRIELITTRNGQSINLLTAANPYADLVMPTIETGTIKAADGETDLYFRLVKPSNFDPNKKYPAIIYVYGGPHAQMVTNGFGNGVRGWDIYMASKGYIMFSLDNRGSSNRGLNFENATFRQLGIEEGKDQVKGAEYLMSLPYVDKERIGVHGWSFGGHMTTALMLRYPEIFKVGVAGGPVIDWAYYEVMYGERYMDTPQTNPEGYKECNLNNHAGNLKGRLLIIHDDHDDTCVPQHTLSFMKACVDAGTYPDLFIYPNHKHNVMGKDRVHLHEKITRYFEDNL